MRIYKLHSKLKKLLLLGCIFVGFFSIFSALVGQYAGNILSRWQLGAIAIAFFGVFYTPIVFASKMHRGWIWWSGALSLVYCFAGLLFSLAVHKTYLACIALSGGVASGFYFWMFYEELYCSFRTAKLRWFEGFPKPLPRIHASLNQNGAILNNIGVARLDSKGAFFIFENRSQLASFKKMGLIHVVLNSKDHSLKLGGWIRAVVERESGIGVEFDTQKADDREELGWFLRHLEA